MPWYFCTQRQERVWVCPLYENFVYRDGRKDKCSKISWWGPEIEEHLKKHGIEDTEPIGDGIVT